MAAYNIKLLRKDGLFGVILDDEEVVPNIHEDAKRAIGEFIYFEEDNNKNVNKLNKKPYITYHTLQEIAILENILKKQLITNKY